MNIPQRVRTPAYWTAEINEVRRCSWFYKGVDFRLIPYEEHVAEQLEEEYKDASHTGEWQRKIPLTSGETVIFNGPSDILHFLQSQSAEGWNTAVVSENIRNLDFKNQNTHTNNSIIFKFHSRTPNCDHEQ